MLTLTSSRSGKKFKVDPFEIKSIKNKWFGSKILIGNKAYVVRESARIVRAKRETALANFVSYMDSL